MSNYNQVISTLNIEEDARNWIISLSDTFKQQFIFYYCSVGHTLDKSINRAFAETDAIYIESKYRIKDILNMNISDQEKITHIRNIISN